MSDSSAAVLVIFCIIASMLSLSALTLRLETRRKRRAAAAPRRGQWVQVDPAYSFIPGLAGKWGRVESLDLESLIVVLYIEDEDMPINAAFDRNMVPFHVEDLITADGGRL